jgi:ATP sulfurylase
MLKDYDSLIQKEFKQQQAIYSMVNSLERLGLDRNDIKKMILSKDLSGVAPSEKDLKSIMNGRFSPLEYGGQKAEWKGIRDSIRGKIGEQDDTPFVDKAFEVRDGFRELERNYKHIELAAKPPKLQIGD